MRRLCGIFLAGCAVTLAATVPVSYDLWDVSTNGTSITGSSDAASGLVDTCNLLNMFGAVGCGANTGEAENAIFWDYLDDQQLGQYVDWVTWQVDTPVTIGHFNLFAWADPLMSSNDCPAPYNYPSYYCYPRTMGHFDLAYWAGDHWEQMYDTGVAVPHISINDPAYRLYLTISEDVLNTAPATMFRAEFTTAVESSRVWPGVRIVELDGFGGSSPVPEPSESLPVALAAGLLAGVTRRRRLHRR